MASTYGPLSVPARENRSEMHEQPNFYWNQERFLRGHASVTRALSAQLVADHGLTLNDYEALLHLSRAETYQFIRKALNRGLIRAVAHVHSDRNHQPRAWDIDSPNRELLWLRQERIRGRFRTCVPAGAATPGGAKR